MGAWGAETFDNDTAADWAWGIENCADLRYVHDTLEEVLAVQDDYLDADLACQGLAACEVIARLKGNWGTRNAYSESVDDWVESHKIMPDPEIIDAAVKVINRVLTEPSELLELWNEVDGGDWVAAVDDLRSRVTR